MAEGGLEFSSSEESSPELPRRPVKFGLSNGDIEKNNNLVLPKSSGTFSGPYGLKAIMNNMVAKASPHIPVTSSSQNHPKSSTGSYGQGQVLRIPSKSTLQSGLLPNDMTAVVHPAVSKVDIEQAFQYHQQQHGCNQEEECWQRDCKTHKGRYQYELVKAKLKSSSGISAMLAGFSMVAIIELTYDDKISHELLITLAVVTTLVVSVHLLSLMMSTCILAYVTAHGCSENSPHKKLWFYIELSWIFSTCIGLILFLVMVGVVFFIKFNTANYEFAAYVTTVMLICVVIIFAVISYLIHRSRFSHTISQAKSQFNDLEKIFTNYTIENGRIKNV